MSFVNLINNIGALPNLRRTSAASFDSPIVLEHLFRCNQLLWNYPLQFVLPISIAGVAHCAKASTNNPKVVCLDHGVSEFPGSPPVPRLGYQKDRVGGILNLSMDLCI